MGSSTLKQDESQVNGIAEGSKTSVRDTPEIIMNKSHNEVTPLFDSCLDKLLPICVVICMLILPSLLVDHGTCNHKSNQPTGQLLSERNSTN